MSQRHSCPGPGCTAQVPKHLLMCRGCWRRVPSAIQREVYASYQRGAGAGTAAHRAAMEKAIASLMPQKKEIVVCAGCGVHDEPQFMEFCIGDGYVPDRWFCQRCANE